MSIALATKGRLVPTGGTVVIHEKFTDVVSDITYEVKVVSQVEYEEKIIAMVKTCED